MTHDGACGHCGTPVDRRFNTCPACGAVWARVLSPFGRFLGFLLAIPVMLALVLLPVGLSKGDGEGLLIAAGAAAFLFVVVRVVIPACATWGWWRTR